MKNTILFLVLITFFSCQNGENKAVDTEKTTAQVAEKPRAKFEPADGKCILFVGQELEAIGGLERWNNGYLDHFDKPGGFTMYTKIRPGDEEFGFTYSGLAGTETTDDWGDGPNNMSLQLADEDFKDMALAIGLELVNHEEEVAAGQQDSLVIALGNFIKKMGKRPVFLRIGYEFGGSWNGYDREKYVAAFRRIKDLYDDMKIENIAYIWQSHGGGDTMDTLESWYPGDEYVDWCGYSFFANFDQANMIEFARKKAKPVFIAEATPTIAHSTIKGTGKTKETILSNPTQAKEAWEKWFIPFFKTIDENPDVVKAVSYINCHWKAHRMWTDNPVFQDIDARLQTSDFIAEKWRAETSKEKYLKANEGFLEK